MNEFDYLKKYNIQRKINGFAKKYKNIVIYGAGKLSEYICKNYDLSKLNITAFADKKFVNGGTFNGYTAIPPEEIKNTDADCILIFNINAHEIINYIIDNLLSKTPSVKIEWILRQNLIDYISNKIKYGRPKQKQDKKYIFTFWEPESKIPAYIRLCMHSWKKFLPEYEIVVLNYKNLDKWLGFEYFDEYLYKAFSLPKQADAVRAAVLYKHGGIWLDADTIITSEKIKDIINQSSDVTMFNTHIGFIVAKKGAKVIKQWLTCIKHKIFVHKIYNTFSAYLKYLFNPCFIVKLDNWNYFGNSVIDKIRKKANNKEFLSLERTDYFALPENNYHTDENISPYDKYVDFYFNNDFSEYVRENEKGIICLHNSWTPKNYSFMTEDEFISQECTISKLLKYYC